MKGIIFQASGGTLFLDEIGDMPLALQTRLLRVLEEREVVPLGCEKPTKVDLRVVCASHQSLRSMIARGQFREDLYYRLNGITLELPRLADRTDKERLIRQLLSKETSDGRPAAIEMDAFRCLLTYDWPGNIRELRNVIRTALAICDGGVVRLRDLPERSAQRQRQHLLRAANHRGCRRRPTRSPRTCAPAHRGGGARSGRQGDPRHQGQHGTGCHCAPSEPQHALSELCAAAHRSSRVVNGRHGMQPACLRESWIALSLCFDWHRMSPWFHPGASRATVLRLSTGEVQLNGHAWAILLLCDGSRCRDRVVKDALRHTCGSNGMTDVMEFLDAASARGWIVEGNGET